MKYEGVQFEILVDGKLRSYRDVEGSSVRGAAQFLKGRNDWLKVLAKEVATRE